MITHRCEKCIWFDNQHKRVKEPDNNGYCRVTAPIAVFNKQEYEYIGHWILVDKKDFCAKFREDK